MVHPCPQAARRSRRARSAGAHAAIAAGLLLLVVTPVGAQQQARQTTAADPRVFHQYAPGLLARTNFTADSGAVRIEQWDLLVGPGMTSADTTLPGGGVFEVRAGTGQVTLDGRTEEIAAGRTFTVNAGHRFAFRNARPDLGLAIRVTLLSRRVP